MRNFRNRRSRQQKPQPPSLSPRAARNYYIAAVVAILLAAAAVRLMAADNELWLDEIWSYRYAIETVKTPLDVLTKVHIDNNHPLNTLMMHYIGPNKAFILYRLPAVAAGVGAAALAGLIALRIGRVESVAAMLLASSSFMLIQYSSEARGYAPALFFSMLCLFLGLKYFDKPRLWIAAIFWVSVVAAVLSHMTAVYFYAAFLAWSVFVLFRSKEGWWKALYRQAVLHAVPLAVLAVYFITCASKMQIGGGDEYGTWDVVADTVTLFVGAPRVPVGIAIASAAALASVACGLWIIRRKDGLWIFFALCVFVLPGIFLVVRAIFLALKAEQLHVLYERYFLVCEGFFLVLAGIAMGRLFRKGAWGKAVFGLVLAAFLAANWYQTAWLIKVGRGHYMESIRYMAGRTAGDKILVSSDHDFRNPMLLDFYAQRLHIQKQLVYIRLTPETRTVPEWFIKQGRTFEPISPTFPDNRPIYVLEPEGSSEILSPGHPKSLSGWSWYIYHLTKSPP